MYAFPLTLDDDGVRERRGGVGEFVPGDVDQGTEEKQGKESESAKAEAA